MTAIILAGGKSRRFGSDKAFIKLKGEPIIKRQIRLLREIFSRQAILNEGGIPPKAGKKIIIVSDNPKKFRFKNIKVVTDIIKNRGPLSGIHAGLTASGSFYNFVVACDMPFLNKRLIRYMIRQKNNYDVLVPKIEGRYHPLFGVYSKNCIPVIKGLLKKERRKVSGIFPKVKSGFIAKRQIQKFDKDFLSLANINTKQDLAKIKCSKEY